MPVPSPMHESESEVAQSCPTLSDPMDWSLPGSSIHGIFQARVLEWGATAFSARDVRGKQRLLSYVGWSGLSSKLPFLKEVKNQVIQEEFSRQRKQQAQRICAGAYKKQKKHA